MSRQESVAEERFNFLGPPDGPGELGWLAHFRVLRLLGKGGMGIVFAAEDRHLRRCVALKVLKPALAYDFVARQRFLREAQAAAALRHDHVVTIYQVGQEHDLPYLVMELLDGESLNWRLEREPRPPLALVLRWGREMAEGLAAAHAVGLIHRDIKPANIWLEAPAERVKILDFGLARSLQDDTRLTESGMVIGTPAYMPPEQVSGAETDGRSDLFSLGCLLYQMAAGQLPFQGNNTLAFFSALAVQVPRNLRELDATIPPAFAELVQSLLAKQREERPASAREVADHLRTIERDLAGNASAHEQEVAAVDIPMLTSSGQMAIPPSSGTELIEQKPRRWRPVLAALALAAGLLSLAWLVGFGFQTNTPSPHPFAPGTPSSQPADPPRLTALDRLRPEQIPAAERFPWQPPELVAVIGTNRAAHWDKVWHVALSPDGKLAAAANGNLVHLWDTATGQLHAILHGHTDTVRFVTFAPDGQTVASGSLDGIVKIWDSATGQEKASWQNTHLSLDPGAFGYDGRILVGGGLEGNIRLWDARTGREVVTWKGHEVPLWSLALANDGKTLVTAARDSSVKVWDVGTRQEKASLKGHSAKVDFLVFSPDGGNLASLARGSWTNPGELKLWDAGSWKELAAFSGEEIHVKCLALSANGVRLLTDRNKDVRVWDGQTLRPTSTLSGHTDVIYSVAVTPDGTLAASGSLDGTLRLWDLDKKQERHVLGQASGAIRDAEFTPDGAALALAGADGVALWRANSGTTEALFPKPPSAARSVAVSSDGKLLVGVAADGTPWLWDVDAGKRRTDLKQGPFQVTLFALAPDGQTLVTADSAIAHLWDLTSGKWRRALPPHPDQIIALAFSPDSQYVATGCRDGGVRLFASNTGQEQGRLLGHKTYIKSVAFLHDDRTLAIGSLDRTVRLWDYRARRQHRTLEGHHGEVIGVAAAPNGQLLASTSTNGDIILWDLSSGEKLRHWQMPGSVPRLCFSPDSRYLATVNGNGTVNLLRLTEAPAGGGR
ncbi:MAG: protein kinase domain-containing protein [Gemmataceae bacterium]